MTTELTNAAQQALEALESASNGLTWYQQEHPEDDSPADEEMHEALNQAMRDLRNALTQRPAAQEVASEARELAHNMMLWREDARMHGSEYVPVHVRTLDNLIAQLRGLLAPQQATPATACGKGCACFTQCGDYYDHHGQATPEPVGEHAATVAEVHMSRYTLEWNGAPLPEGTKLYTRHAAAPAGMALRLEDELQRMADDGPALIHLQSGSYICQKLGEGAALLRTQAERIASLEADLNEQARLVGMGAERELALMAERDKLRAEVERLREFFDADMAVSKVFDEVSPGLTSPKGAEWADRADAAVARRCAAVSAIESAKEQQ